MAHVVSRPLHGWRKLAGAAWGAPNDPQFYGELEVDATGLLDLERSLREHTSVHVTLTHLVGRAVAHGLTAVPEIGMRLAHGREYARESIDVFFIVAGEQDELTGVKVERADQKSAVEIAEDLIAATHAISTGEDEAFGKTKKLLDVLPTPVLRQAIRLSSWLTSDLDLDLPRLGMRRESFGSAMITSVGMWGVRRAFSPLARYYKVPLLVLVGAVEPRPVVVAGKVVVRPMLSLTATFDHRYVDGSHAARFAQAVQEYCAHPQQFEPVGATGKAS